MKYPYHAFLSHAVEDKIGIANDLYEALTAKGLNIWYSGRELNVGDSIVDRIHEGLDQCRYGIVIISPTYLDKVWGIYEFATLVSAKAKGDKIILPVLYNMTAVELAERAPMLVDTFCLHHDRGISAIAEALDEEITKPTPGIQLGHWKKHVYRLLILAFVLLGSYYGYTKLFPVKPDVQVVESVIQKRIADLQQMADARKQEFVLTGKNQPMETELNKRMFIQYKEAKSYYRNEYFLNTGLENIHSKVNVERILDLNLDNVSLANNYALETPLIFYVPATYAGNRQFFIIRQEFSMPLKKQSTGKYYEVTVSYTNPLRVIQTSLKFPSSSGDTRHHQVNFIALPSVETLSFTTRGGLGAGQSQIGRKQILALRKESASFRKINLQSR